MCRSFGEAMPPVASISRCGLLCSSLQAASIALYSMEFLSGLNSSCSTMFCIDSGNLLAFNCSTYSAWISACCFFFSMPAWAARRDCSGAAL